MSRIETYIACTNLTDDYRASKITQSSKGWGFKSSHDKNRGRVIAAARLLYGTLLKAFPIFCIPTCSGTELVNHHIKTTRYFLSAINRFDFYLRIVSQGLDLLTSHIHAHPIYQRFSTYQYKYCGSKSITIFRRTN